MNPIQITQAGGWFNCVCPQCKLEWKSSDEAVQPTQCPNGCLGPLTLKTMQDLIAKMPKVNVARYCVTTPEYARRLFAAVPEDEPHTNLLKGNFGSIEIIEKPGQRAAAWFISSPMILRAYLDGWVTEDDLEKLQKMED
jgi:hypothetical protein